jgi:DNA invertase Pin-like site-specific DNA recombinase
MKAILYCRVSSEEQAKGFSLDAQEQEGREYAKRRGIEIVRTFKVTESASHEGREVFNEAVNFLTKQTSVEIFLVFKQDRAIRNFGDMALLDQLAHRHNKQIHFYHENWEYTKASSIADFYRFGFMSVISTGFSRNLSDITKVGMQKKAESGQFPANAPYGYRNNKQTRTIEPDPEEAKWVVRMKELAAGDISLEGIAARIRKEGCPRRFVRSAVERIVKSTFYHGLFEWGGQTYRGDYKPIVSIELHNAAVRGISDRTKGKYSKQRLPYCGLMTCASCGSRITGERRKGRYVYYHCTWGQGKCSNTEYVKAEALDRQFAEILGRLRVDEAEAKLMTDELEKRSGLDRARRESRLAWLHAERQRIARRSEKAYEDKLDGKIEEADWLVKSKRWNEQLVEIDSEIRNLEGRTDDALSTLKKILELMNSLKSQFEALPDDKKGQLLRFVLWNLKLDHGTISFSYTNPFALFEQKVTLESMGRWGDRVRTCLIQAA